MEAPVIVEVAAGAERAQAEHGLGAADGPARAGDVHAVADEVAAGAFDDAGGDGQAVGEVLVVAEVGCVGEEVVGTVVDGDAVLGGEFAQGGAAAHAGGNPRGATAAHAGGNPRGATAEDLEEPFVDPAFGLGGALGVKRPCRLPHVVEHVDDVDDHRELDALALGVREQAVELAEVAVDDRGPAFLVLRVPALRLGEQVGDHVVGVLLDAGPDALVLGAGARDRLGVAAQLRDEILGASDERFDRVHRRDLRHALAAALLALRQPPLQLALGEHPGHRTRSRGRAGALGA